MANKSGKGNEYCNLKEVLDMLRFDKNSDEEDFANQSQNYQSKNQTDKMMQKNWKIVTLNYLFFLRMKIYKDPVYHNKVTYLAEMVKYGTENLPVQ